MSRMWQKVVVACFKLLYWYSPGGTEEEYSFSEHNRSPVKIWTRYFQNFSQRICTATT